MEKMHSFKLFLLLEHCLITLTLTQYRLYMLPQPQGACESLLDSPVKLMSHNLELRMSAGDSL